MGKKQFPFVFTPTHACIGTNAPQSLVLTRIYYFLRTALYLVVGVLKFRQVYQKKKSEMETEVEFRIKLNG